MAEPHAGKDGHVEMGQEQEPLAHLARYREATYRLLSGTFMYPAPERLAALTAAAADLWEERASLARFPFFPELRVALQDLRQLSEDEGRELETEYVRLFTASRGQIPCPPYESSYRVPPGEATGWLLAEVESSYSAAALGAAAEQHELPDHISVELEFMALLCGREATAWERRSTRVADHMLGGEQRFLESHVLRWLPLLARRVSAADAASLWASAATGAVALAHHDVDFVAALRDMILTDGAPPGRKPAQGEDHTPSAAEGRTTNG